MKKLKASLMIMAMGIIFSTGIMAQPPSPPANQGTAGDQTPSGGGGTGAPLSPGTGILLIMAAGYGLKKFYDLKKKPVF